MSEFTDLLNEASSLDEMAYPAGFSLEELKKIRTFKGRLEYVKSHLGNHVGKGSSRIVFPVDNNKVLKLAWNAKGKAQNEVEATSEGLHDILAEVFDYADDYSWIEMEKITPFKSESQFKSKTGMTSNEFNVVLRKLTYDYLFSKRFGETEGKLPKKFKSWKDVWDDPFIFSISTFLVDFGLMNLQFVGEFSQLKHYGINGKGEVKLLDYGLNDEVLKKYYNY